MCGYASGYYLKTDNIENQISFELCWSCFYNRFIDNLLMLNTQTGILLTKKVHNDTKRDDKLSQLQNPSLRTFNLKVDPATYTWIGSYVASQPVSQLTLWQRRCIWYIQSEPPNVSISASVLSFGYFALWSSQFNGNTCAHIAKFVFSSLSLGESFDVN